MSAMFEVIGEFDAVVDEVGEVTPLHRVPILSIPGGPTAVAVCLNCQWRGTVTTAANRANFEATNHIFGIAGYTL